MGMKAYTYASSENVEKASLYDALHEHSFRHDWDGIQHPALVIRGYYFPSNGLNDWTYNTSGAFAYPANWPFSAARFGHTCFIVRVHVGGSQRNSTSSASVAALTQRVYSRADDVFDGVENCYDFPATLLLQAIHKARKGDEDHHMITALAGLLTLSPAVTLTQSPSECRKLPNPRVAPDRSTVREVITPTKIKIDVPITKEFKLSKSLANQLMQSPGPLGAWDKLISVQAWHLTILIAFETGLYTSYLPNILPLGIETVLREIKTAIIERAGIRFPEFRRIYHDSANRQELEKTIKHCVKTFEEETGVLQTDPDSTILSAKIIGAFMVALSHLLLLLRALPYAHDPNVMARSEAQRLSRITRKVGITDAEFLREAGERLSNYVTLWGPKWFSFLQPELRGLLPHLVELLTEPSFIGRFMELANEFVKTLATQMTLSLDELLHKNKTTSGIMVAFPGQVKSTTMRIFTTANDLSRMSDISDSLQKELNTHNGTADLVSSFLTYVTEILGSPNTMGAIMGADGTASASTVLALSDPFDNVIPAPLPHTVMAQILAKPPILAVPAQTGIVSQPAVDANFVNNRDTNARMDRLEELLRKGIADNAEATRAMASTSLMQYRQLMDHAAHGQRLQQAQLEQVMPDSLSHAKPIYSLPKRVLYADQQQLYVDNTRTERQPQPLLPYKPQWRSGNAPSRTPNAGRFGPRLRDQMQERTSRPPRLDAQGKVIFRLMDKPPTPWDEIDTNLKVHLAAFGIRSAQDYLARGEEPCVLCGPNADHCSNRCVKVWAASEKGRNGMGVVRAAEKVRQALSRPPQPSEICTIADSLMCFECALANIPSAEDDTEATILYLVDAYGLNDTDSADLLFEAAEQATYHARMYALSLECSPSQ